MGFIGSTCTALPRRRGVELPGQPQNSCDGQVVGGLVEQEEVRGGEEGCSEGSSDSPPATQSLHLPVGQVLREGSET